MLQRLLNPLKSQHFFLLGARSTGKTSYLREFFRDKRVLWFDLLSERLFLELSANPSIFSDQIKAANQLEQVVVDEVQRIPGLLNEVHSLIEEPATSKIKFALTGSSARKLKRGGGNLLAGRALINHMFPLTCRELGETFSLPDVLKWGSLPRVITAGSELEREELLRAYVETYIRDEIRMEQLVRNLDPFLRFVEVAAQMNGEIINYSAIGRESRVEPRTVERYYQILEDTLIGFFLEPYHRSVRKRQVSSPKFYLFDLGVANCLSRNLGAMPAPRTYGYGKLFEQFIVLELFRLNSYLRKGARFSFLRTHDDAEIDLIVERKDNSLAAIEIKSSDLVGDDRVNKLIALAKDIRPKRLLIISNEKQRRKVDSVDILPWREALEEAFE